MFTIWITMYKIYFYLYRADKGDYRAPSPSNALLGVLIKTDKDLT